MSTLLEARSPASEDLQPKPGCPVCGAHVFQSHLSAPDRFHRRSKRYRLLRCPECSCVWMEDPPQPHEMGIHYSADYHRAIMVSGETAPLARWGWAREGILQYKREGAILDVGCSSGSFLSTMKDGAWSLYGIDMETSTAKRAEKATGAKVFVGDALAAPFAPGTFDVITSFDLLEHVYEPRRFLVKVHEWLKPGGIYFVALPNIDSWEARFFGSHWYGLELPRHLTHFSPKSLRFVMSSLNFRELKLSTQVSYADRSVGYLCDTVLAALGISPTPASEVGARGLAHRALRRLVTLTTFDPLGAIAGKYGAGASIVGVFQKVGE
jgi:2-polyprenyl-3-methyl-5-hydroxy-6-metoxy-1,4-benzoquinol methylase